ncbi:hypothetical protein BGW38_002516 [Lunasporangiospora selenospora]|uniref:Uncharacterized protein n=1 Tax=Lunasporangiospora selenospora TaxID=979761 RepID=A0A9P6KDD2_9FUNG|nr:hypothetical protein BGW38_002516 [Lunasporangiospora selenospora]
MSFEYTGCKSALESKPVPDSSFVHSSAVGDFGRPTYIIKNNVSIPVPSATGAGNFSYPVSQCTVSLTVPVDIQPPLYMYYKLTNFYQNHRKYTKSLDYKQLGGEASTAAEIVSRKGCILPAGELIYPCGLIANSLFNDTIGNLVAVDPAGAAGETYAFQHTGISWPSDKDRFKKYGYTDLTQILPPPNWRDRYPKGVYSADYPPPDIQSDEHFQVWMRTAGWPTFLKTYGRNPDTVLKAGNYQMTIDMNFPIETYGGKKYIVFSTTGAIGGRNNSLGIGFIIIAVISAALGLIFTAFHIIRPRIIGDHSKISFSDGASSGRSTGRDDTGGNRVRSRYEDD